jgi:hypothetical protein
VKDVVGLDYETMQELKMKKRNVTFDNFQELDTNYILVYEGAVIVIMLHDFVSSDQASEYFTVMANMWEFSGRVTKTCSLETRMAMFGQIFYYNDCVPTR